MDQDQIKLEQEIAQLEQQLKDIAAAEQFYNFEAGRIIERMLTADITRLTREITSEKYVKDHTGYVNCLSELRANKNLLRKLQMAINPDYKERVAERLAVKNEQIQDGQ